MNDTTTTTTTTYESNALSWAGRDGLHACVCRRQHVLLSMSHRRYCDTSVPTAERGGESVSGPGVRFFPDNVAQSNANIWECAITLKQRAAYQTAFLAAGSHAVRQPDV